MADCMVFGDTLLALAKDKVIQKMELMQYIWCCEMNRCEGSCVNRFFFVENQCGDMVVSNLKSDVQER